MCKFENERKAMSFEKKNAETWAAEIKCPQLIMLLNYRTTNPKLKTRLYQNRTLRVSITNSFVYCSAISPCKSHALNFGMLLGNIVCEKFVIAQDCYESVCNSWD